MIVGLAARFIVGLTTAVVIDRLGGEIIGVDVLADTGVIVVVVAVANGVMVAVPVSCVEDVWVGVIDVDVTVATRVGMVVRVLIDLLTDAIVVILTGSGADVFAGVDENMLAVDLEFIDVREDSLRFCCC